MWLKSWKASAFALSFVLQSRFGVTQDEGFPQTGSLTNSFSESAFDCSNSTHRWHSQDNACLLDVANSTSLSTPQKPLEQRNPTGRFLGGLGLRIRDVTCAANETRCWVVNCCQPGETCGPINVGCTASYSSIYTTTTVTSWSTITNIMTPSSGVSYTTIDVTSTAYLTSWKPITLSGNGQNTVLETSTTTTTTLILSAHTPDPTTVTTTVQQGSSVTNAPKVRKDIGRAPLPRANIPRQDESIRYTTITVIVTNFYTTSTTSTMTDGLVTMENTVTISSIATQNQTFYKTPTAFTTITQTITETSSSYAFGQLDAVTQTATTTVTQPSSEVAGTTPTGTNDPSSSNPPGAYPAGSSHKLSKGAIAGLVVGIILALILLAILVGLICCIRRRRRNRRAGYDREVRTSRHLVDAPSPPSPPVPQMAMATPSPHSSDESPSPPTLGAVSKNGYHSNNGYGSSSRYHGRKSSRSSVVSITPVPEEDEDDLENAENGGHHVMTGVRRNSGESTRSWGRGYGGRGGYNGRTQDGRPRNNNNVGSTSPTNPAFRGVMTSTYSDESLVPPHARRGSE